MKSYNQEYKQYSNNSAVERWDFINKRRMIEKLIREISKICGGDDEAFLKIYIDEVVENNKSDMDKAVKCFENILRVYKL